MHSNIPAFAHFSTSPYWPSAEGRSLEGRVESAHALHCCAIAAVSLRLEGGLQGTYQRLLVERLAQKAHGSSVHGASSEPLFRESSDEDDGDALTLGDEPALQVKGRRGQAFVNRCSSTRSARGAQIPGTARRTRRSRLRIPATGRGLPSPLARPDRRR